MFQLLRFAACSSTDNGALQKLSLDNLVAAVKLDNLKPGITVCVAARTAGEGHPEGLSKRLDGSARIRFLVGRAGNTARQLAVKVNISKRQLELAPPLCSRMRARSPIPPHWRVSRRRQTPNQPAAAHHLPSITMVWRPALVRGSRLATRGRPPAGPDRQRCRISIPGRPRAGQSGESLRSRSGNLMSGPNRSTRRALAYRPRRSQRGQWTSRTGPGNWATVMAPVLGIGR
jgi:hypothetical protein